MTDYISRRDPAHKGLIAMGWRRTRRSRRRIQPEVWKLKKVWVQAHRELVVRIVRHDGLFRAEVVRVIRGEVWWQPLRDMDMDCPLALATLLHFDGVGDPVYAAYREARPYVDDASDFSRWVRGHPAQMPWIVTPKTRWGDHATDTQSYVMQSQYRQAFPAFQGAVRSTDFYDLEARVAATLSSNDDGGYP